MFFSITFTLFPIFLSLSFPRAILFLISQHSTDITSSFHAFKTLFLSTRRLTFTFHSYQQRGANRRQPKQTEHGRRHHGQEIGGSKSLGSAVQRQFPRDPPTWTERKTGMDGGNLWLHEASAFRGDRQGGLERDQGEPRYEKSSINETFNLRRRPHNKD